MQPDGGGEEERPAYGMVKGGGGSDMEGASTPHAPSVSDGSASADSCAEDEVTKQSLNENEMVEEPQVGMVFISMEDVRDYYKKYSNQVGFGIRRRSVANGDDGKIKYFVYECQKAGKRRKLSKNPLKPSRSTKTDCKARIRAVIRNESCVMLNTVELKHNHALSTTPSTAQLFSEKVCRNYIENARRSRLGVRDAVAIQNYFVRMKEKNSSFFYVMDFDDDSHIRNLFWADARCRAAYEAFGDVVSVDTTYLTNKYGMPLAPLVGVNHHGQTVLLGCGLLSNEDIETFVWLFESWLACMSGCAPKAIITDQCKVMQRAIERVFPDTRHRWCLWHIMKKIPEKLRGYSQYEAIKEAMQNAVYDTLTRDEFEEEWRAMIDNFDLKDNEWLGVLYNERHRWVPIYLKDTFWAGMSTTQRSESMSAFFDGYVNPKTTLKQFVEQYDNALRSKVEKEKKADFHSFNKMYDCFTNYDMEKQFQGVYTNAKFKEVQEEFKRILYCHASLVKEEGPICTYKVREDVKLGDRRKQVVFDVYFHVVECAVQCMCHLFEFTGIMCGHSLSVLTERQVKVVPPKYILARWRKDLKRRYTFVKSNYSDLGLGSTAQRYDKMYKKFSEVAALAANMEERCSLFISSMDEVKDKFLTDGIMCGSNQVVCGSNQVALVTGADQSIQMTEERSKVLSPLVVRRKGGRPPSKRKVSKIDELQLEAQKKGKKQKKGQQDEAPPTSYSAHTIDEIGMQGTLNLMAQPSCFLGSSSTEATPTLTQSQMVNQIGNQNQVFGSGFLNLHQNFSEGGQSSFWGGGYVAHNVFPQNMDQQHKD